MPAGGGQRQHRDAIGLAVPDADVARLAGSAVGGIVHRAVYDVAAGCGALHAMREFDAVFHQAAWVPQVADAERVEVLADGGDDLVVR